MLISCAGNMVGMAVTIEPGELGGTTQAPPSKSYTHRAILAAGYSATDHETVIARPLLSADTLATARGIDALGATVDQSADGRLTIKGMGRRPKPPADILDCANSGTTMRLLTAAAALGDGITVLTGDDSLRTRPQKPLLEAIEQLGGRAESTRENGQAPLVVKGPIDGGEVAIRGDISSQFITALLMAGAKTTTGITIDVTTELRSAPYVRITQELLDAFGIETDTQAHGFVVPGDQIYHADRYTVPADFSSLSYLLAAGVIAAPEGLTVTGVTPSAQGDQAIIDLLADMGGTIEWDRDATTVTVTRSTLSGRTISVADIPDLLPTLAVVGAYADGTTRLTDAEHVRYKETDRVSAMATALEKLGAVVEEREDELRIDGDRSTLTGGTVDGRQDHRVIMALAVAGLAGTEPTTITNAEHVAVSFPEFFDVIRELGGSVTGPN